MDFDELFNAFQLDDYLILYDQVRTETEFDVMPLVSYRKGRLASYGNSALDELEAQAFLIS